MTTPKELLTLRLQCSHLQALITALKSMTDPNIFNIKFWILKSKVPRNMYTIPYVFISLTDPDQPQHHTKNIFPYSFIGVGHPNIPYLIIRPYLKNMNSLEGMQYANCKGFVPFNGTFHGFLSELSYTLKVKIERKDLVKEHGTLTELFENMHLYSQLPTVKSLAAKARVEFLDVQNFSSDFPHEKKERRDSPIKPKIAYLNEMIKVTDQIMEKYFSSYKI
ncbi:MAG: hypothetical protein Hyperionvirus26_23 [Hyperionvirus sp.]|uniref:Guanylate cyclase domain-containing protein n=1 Tax=Hyperionvirus sp. TaxID=2487770 RepID=A0A3G5AB51_9VIRU|nr:MAG: hypothetical protein Hyperionvirus26_23 [Hyperionvirus sp.]